MSNALSLRCIYLSCKVLYFILSDDDFEIRSKIYSFNLHLVLKHILHSHNSQTISQEITLGNYKKHNTPAEAYTPPAEKNIGTRWFFLKKVNE